MAKLSVVIFLLAVFTVYSLLPESVEATYRKPPFNGSIFGKRTNGVEVADYENANKALSAMCEIAVDACTSWFPLPEK